MNEDLEENVETTSEKLDKADELIELKKKVESQKVEIEDKDDRLKRLMAEFDNYKKRSAKERENAVVKEHKTVFLMQIGSVLKSGKKHDGRAPDYDDWALNGDVLFWNDVLECAFEISSMGIRVDAESLRRQLEIEGVSEREKFPFHQGILTNEYPLTIGGGIGQSRLCMLLLDKAHIGEVQCSIWPDEMRETCKKNNIILL